MPPPLPSPEADMAPTQTQTIVSTKAWKAYRRTCLQAQFLSPALFHHPDRRGLLILPWIELRATLSQSHSPMQGVPLVSSASRGVTGRLSLSSPGAERPCTSRRQETNTGPGKRPGQKRGNGDAPVLLNDR